MTSLSIVTITYNDDDGLARTLSSLQELVQRAGKSVELIVVDGGQRAETRSLVESAIPGAQVVSEEDDGIYDAMNKGLARAVGSHIWFLNGGDEAIASWPEIARILESNRGSVVLGDYVLAGRSIDLPRRSRRAGSLWHALPTSHQAILYPREQINSIRYEQRYGIVADYAFTAELFVRGVQFVRGRVPLARFHLDGVSNEQAVVIGKQAAVVQKSVLKQAPLLSFLSRCRHTASRQFRRVLAGRAE